MKIGVFGAGYVGLVTAACFAELGHQLMVVEKNKEKLEKLKSGQNTIYEPDLDELLQNNTKNGRLTFFLQTETVVENCDVLFLCVGTPPKEDGSADMSQIESAIIEIIRCVSPSAYKLIVLKSTVPVGTAARLKELIQFYKDDKQIEIEIASNPEFLKEGVAVDDFMNPERIVMGVSSQKAAEILQNIYQSFSCPKIVTNSNTAEIIKYAANSFLATKISFINMVSDLCDAVGADVRQVALGMGYDDRIGSKFLKAGIGFGGSCFPKDLRAFAHAGDKNNLNFNLLDEVIRINNERPAKMVNKLKDLLWVLTGKTIGILGLTFKPETDDVRETPAFPFIDALLKEGAKVRVFDPIGMSNFKTMFHQVSEKIDFASDEYGMSENCDAIVLVTDWKQFIGLDWDRILQNMNLPVILDTRNCLNGEEMTKKRFIYADTSFNYAKSRR
ncbi:UDP-glucose dehydrogenase family protein [Paenibacillus humicola]|uniref:UDP-glucose dehydrogenase family protein n=1 Tax=Paenibacillus humicola TaxID=3110540 RepID=UPI00237A1954|nr:UDP-glucose/GDP-mannose dehydrogenase family protein [Paenibacillus humicola]